MIYGNPVGGAISPKTFELVIEGSEKSLDAVVVDSFIKFDATENDVRSGKKFATNTGYSVGTKDIPAYETRMSYLLIKPGDVCSIPLSIKDSYAYTKFQCVIVVHSSDYSSNVTTKYISINDKLFSSETSEFVSNITQNAITKSIDLNITNNSEDTYEVIYFTYKEI